MSNALFPTLPGLSWGIQKEPEFNTKVQRAVDLSELRASFTSTPVWHFLLSYDLLRGDATNAELQQILGFFLARQGSFDSFLYADPDDSVATLEPFGTGDGSDQTFQLRRAMGVFTEDVCNVAASPAIYKAGVLQTVTTDYTVSSTGLVTFVSAPAGGAALTWSGTYYYRCRFKDDRQQFRQFMRQLWDARQVEFIGSLGVKI